MWEWVLLDGERVGAFIVVVCASCVWRTWWAYGYYTARRTGRYFQICIVAASKRGLGNDYKWPLFILGIRHVYEAARAQDLTNWIRSGVLQFTP